MHMCMSMYAHKKSVEYVFDVVRKEKQFWKIKKNIAIHCFLNSLFCAGLKQAPIPYLSCSINASTYTQTTEVLYTGK